MTYESRTAQCEREAEAHVPRLSLELHEADARVRAFKAGSERKTLSEWSSF